MTLKIEEKKTAAEYLPAEKVTKEFDLTEMTLEEREKTIIGNFGAHMPKPPPGTVYRMVHHYKSGSNEENIENIIKARSLGWRPVKATTISDPSFKLYKQFSIDSGRDIFRHQELVLYELPEKIYEMDRAIHQKLANKQIASLGDIKPGEKFNSLKFEMSRGG